MAIEKCPKCGEKVSNNWNSCPYCGQILKEQTIPNKEEFDEQQRILENTVRNLEAVNGTIDDQSEITKHVKAAHKALEYSLTSLAFLALGGLLFLSLLIPDIKEYFFTFVIIAASVIAALGLLFAIVFFIVFLQERKWLSKESKDPKNN